MKRFLILFALLFCQVHASSANVVAIKNAPLDHPQLVNYNFNTAHYVAYQRIFEDSVQAFFKDFDTPQEIRIVQTFDPAMDPYFAFSSKPILADSVRHALQKKLMQLSPIYGRYLSFSNLYTIVINGGITSRDMVFSPELGQPRDIRQNKYAFLGIKENYETIQNWIRTGALPLLVELVNQNPDRLFSYGDEKLILSVDAKKAANDLIQNPNFDLFYRTSLEGFEDNPQLLTTVKILRLAALGQFDYAQLYIAMLYNFEPRNTLVRYILDELSWRLAYYYRLEGTFLAAAESETNPNEKQALIDSVLNVNPLSTAAIFATIDPSRNHFTSSYPYIEQWKTYSRSNPMYIFTRQSASKKEAYHNYLRMTSYDLFMDPETILLAHPNYASVALELEEYDFAADLYWMLKCAIGKKNDSEYALGTPEATLEENSAKLELYEFRYNYTMYQLGFLPYIDKKTKKSFNSLKKSFTKKMKSHAAYKEFTFK